MSMYTLSLLASIKSFANQRLALLPKCPCVLRVEGVSANAAAKALALDDLREMAVLAIAAADRSGICDAGGPHRSRRALRDALPAERCGALGLIGIDLRNHSLHHLGGHVP